MSDLQKFLDAMPLPDGEYITGGTHRADGWVYRDIPGKWTHGAIAKLEEILGDGNYIWLIKSEHPDWMRGQLIISPQGIENMKKEAAKP